MIDQVIAFKNIKDSSVLNNNQRWAEIQQKESGYN